MNTDEMSKEQLLNKLVETRRQVSELEEIELKFKLLVDHTFDWEYWIDQNGKYIYLSPSCERITGYAPDDFISNPRLLYELVEPDYAAKVRQHYEGEYNKEFPAFSMEYPIISKNGELRWLEHNCTPVFDTQRNYIGRRGNNRDITKRVLANEQAGQQAEDLELINTINTAVNCGLDLQDIIKILSEESKKIYDSDSTTVYLYNQEQKKLEMKNLAIPEAMVKRIEKLIGFRIPSINIPVEEGSLTQELLLSDGPRLINESEIIQQWMKEFTNTTKLSKKSRLIIRKLIPKIHKLMGYQSLITAPMVLDGKPIGLMDFSRKLPFNEEEKNRVAGVVGQVTAAIARLQASDEKSRNQRLLLTLSHASRSVQLARTPAEVYFAIGEEAVKLNFEVTVFTLSDDKSHLEIYFHSLKSGIARSIAKLTKLSANNYSFPLKPEGFFQKIIANKEPIFNHLDRTIFEEVLPPMSPTITNKVIDLISQKQSIIAPMTVDNEVIALVSFASTDIAESDIPAITTFVNQAAIAIQNTQLYQDINQRLKKMSALNNIGRAITGSFDLEITMNIILEHLLAQLEVDAAAILSYQEEIQTLQFVYGRGFQTGAIQHSILRLGEGFAGKVALQRDHIFIPDLIEDQGRFETSDEFLEEKFKSYFGVPLIAKGKLIGVLEIFHQSALNPDPEWVNYIKLLADQTAIAMDNINLFNNLQSANVNLSLAYDATIEGWARALELKDMETEGHSRRVVEMTLDIAQKMGFSGEKLAHIRRGALLHDIGKMGIPDSILLKPGKLSDDEWQIMKQHPVYAYQWLSPVQFLQDALAIPYCHHEHWDGTGYPRGLEGEQIPLEARIFAIIDVWDALLWDRPYRKAWSREKVIAHLKEQSGKHFDPKVLDIFLDNLPL